MEHKLVYNIEDFRPININTLENKIKNSPQTARIILFLHNRFFKEGLQMVTVKDVMGYIQTDYSNVYKDMEMLALLGVLERQNLSRKRMRYQIVKHEIKEYGELALNVLRQGKK